MTKAVAVKKVEQVQKDHKEIKVAKVAVVTKVLKEANQLEIKVQQEMRQKEM